MGETKKQRRVRLSFEHFSKLCDVMPSSSFEIWEDTPKDPPDICVGDYELGIEFVDYYRGSGEGGSEIKAREEFFEDIVTRAKVQFEEKYPIPLWVNCFWSNNRPKKTQFHELVSAVVDVIQRQMPTEEGQIVRIGWDDFSETCLVNYIHYINVRRPTSLTKGFWTNLQAGWADDETESFKKLTRKKEKDLPEYKAQFRAVWLVIVAPGDGISSTVALDEPIESMSSDFDRVYFFDAFSNQAILLTEDKG